MPCPAEGCGLSDGKAWLVGGIRLFRRRFWQRGKIFTQFRVGTEALFCKYLSCSRPCFPQRDCWQKVVAITCLLMRIFREESRLSSSYGKMVVRRKGAEKNVLQHQTIHRIEINANFVTGKQTKHILWKTPFLQWIWEQQAAAPS